MRDGNQSHRRAATTGKPDVEHVAARERALLAHEAEASIALPAGAFAVAIDVGAIALAGIEEVEFQRNAAGIAIVDRADEPVRAATLLARDGGIFAHLPGKQAALVPVDRDVLMNWKASGRAA